MCCWSVSARSNATRSAHVIDERPYGEIARLQGDLRWLSFSGLATVAEGSIDSPLRQSGQDVNEDADTRRFARRGAAQVCLSGWEAAHKPRDR